MRRLLPLVLLAACGSSEPAGMDDPIADGLARGIVDAPGEGEGPFADPRKATNGVRGGGMSQGSTDVYSLAVDGPEASLTLSWGGERLVDGPGDDLVVYENPFLYPGGVFFDPIVVELSADGETWVPWPHDYVAEDEDAWSSDPMDWLGFFGRTPVLRHVQDNPTDPLDTALSGGDGLDLADLAEVDGGSALLEAGVRYVRLWSASAWENPDTGLPYPRDPVGNGADIDGVYGRLD